MSFTDAPALPRFIGEALPFPRRMFALSGGRAVHFVDTGLDAPAVLMVHGNPTWSFLWRKVIAALPDLRCVAPNLLGFGLSTKLPRLRDHSIELHADAIAELVRVLDLQRTGAWLEAYEGPMALVWGTRDPILGRALAKDERAFPHATVTRTEAGHFLQEEVPDAIAAAVRAVLS